MKKSTVRTNSSFLFKTAQVVTVGLATPILFAGRKVEITGPDVGAAIQAAFDTLFPDNEQRHHQHSFD